MPCTTLKKSRITLLVPHVPYALTAGNRATTIGMAMISAYLKREGASVTMLDNYLECLPTADLCERLCGTPFDFLAVYVPNERTLAQVVLFLLEFPQLLQTGGKILLAGPFARLAAEEIMPNVGFVDAIILDDDERTLLEILRRGGDDWEGLPVLCRVEGKVTRPHWTPATDGLEHLPTPDLSYYRERFGNEIVYSVPTSRGCSGRCNFCVIHLMNGGHQRTHSLEWIRTYVEELLEMGIGKIHFIDDNILPRARTRERIFELREMILSLPRAIDFSMSCRIDDVVRYRQEITALKEVGLRSVFVGAESFHEPTLALFNKGISSEGIWEAAGILRTAGISCHVGLIFFHPWTTLEEIDANRRGLERLFRENEALVTTAPLQSLQLIFGTPLYDKAKREGLTDGHPLTGCTFRFSDPAVALFLRRWIPRNEHLLRMVSQGRLPASRLVHEQLRLLNELREAFVARGMREEGRHESA